MFEWHRLAQSRILISHYTSAATLKCNIVAMRLFLLRKFRSYYIRFNEITELSPIDFISMLLELLYSYLMVNEYGDHSIFNLIWNIKGEKELQQQRTSDHCMTFSYRKSGVI